MALQEGNDHKRRFVFGWRNPHLKVCADGWSDCSVVPRLSRREVAVGRCRDSRDRRRGGGVSAAALRAQHGSIVVRAVKCDVLAQTAPPGGRPPEKPVVRTGISVTSSLHSLVDSSAVVIQVSCQTLAGLRARS